MEIDNWSDGSAQLFDSIDNGVHVRVREVAHGVACLGQLQQPHCMNSSQEGSQQTFTSFAMVSGLVEDLPYLELIPDKARQADRKVQKYFFLK